MSIKFNISEIAFAYILLLSHTSKKYQYSHRSSSERLKMSLLFPLTPISSPSASSTTFPPKLIYPFLAVPTFLLRDPPRSHTDYCAGLLMGLPASTITPPVQFMFSMADRMVLFKA